MLLGDARRLLQLQEAGPPRLTAPADLHLDQLGNRAACLCLRCDRLKRVLVNARYLRSTVRWTEVMEKPSPSLSMTTSDLLSTCSGTKSAMPSSLTNDMVKQAA